MNDSRVNHVEQVHQNKGMEDDGVKNQSISWLLVLVSQWCPYQVK